MVEESTQEHDQDLHVPEQYVLGFNHAYALASDMPDLRKQVKTPDQEPSEYMQGWDDGWRQYELDLRLDQIRQAGQDKTKNQDQNQSRDR